MSTPEQSGVITTTFQRRVAEHWDTEARPVNLRLGEVDGLYHHHYGLGRPDWGVLAARPDREQRIIAELHRLETAQADHLLDALGPIHTDDRLLDGGSGRGGTAIMAHARFGCQVDGVTISIKQAQFARDQAQRRGIAERVRFHFRNMLQTGFEDGVFAAAWTNETTMYVDLDALYGEFARVLAPGGRYVCITGAINEDIGSTAAIDRINARYDCAVHHRADYLKALAGNGFTGVRLTDLTEQTIPYWELRKEAAVATGVEDDFLTAYKDGSFQYLMLTADLPTPPTS